MPNMPCLSIGRQYRLVQWSRASHLGAGWNCVTNRAIRPTLSPFLCNLLDLLSIYHFVFDGFVSNEALSKCIARAQMMGPIWHQERRLST